MQVSHWLGQLTADYMEFSNRGSLDEDAWEKFRIAFHGGWREFSDASVRLPALARIFRAGEGLARAAALAAR